MTREDYNKETASEIIAGFDNRPEDEDEHAKLHEQEG